MFNGKKKQLADSVYNKLSPLVSSLADIGVEPQCLWRDPFYVGFAYTFTALASVVSQHQLRLRLSREDMLSAAHSVIERLGAPEPQRVSLQIREWLVAQNAQAALGSDYAEMIHSLEGIMQANSEGAKKLYKEYNESLDSADENVLAVHGLDSGSPTDRKIFALAMNYVLREAASNAGFSNWDLLLETMGANKSHSHQ